MNSTSFDNPDTKLFLDCIRSLKRELHQKAADGLSWIMSTENILLPEKKISDPPAVTVPVSVKKIPAPLPRSPIPSATQASPFLPPVKPLTTEPSKSKILEPSFVQLKDGLCLIRLCPSETELLNSLPYTDESGIYLQSLLVEAGFRENLFTKAYLHSSRIDFLPKDAPEALQWKENFLKNLTQTPPKAVLCLGERVSQILSGREEKIDALRSLSQILQGIPFYFNYDPLYMFKKKTLRSALIAEFQTILNQCFRV